jgi:hypothetical protein
MRANYSEPSIRIAIRVRELIFLGLVAALGISVSVSARQVQRAVHGSTESTMTAKTDMPAPAPADVEPVLRFAEYATPQPRTTDMAFAAVHRAAARTVQALWYAVAVQHRPPPRSLS